MASGVRTSHSFQSFSLEYSEPAGSHLYSHQFSQRLSRFALQKTLPPVVQPAVRLCLEKRAAEECGTSLTHRSLSVQITQCRIRLLMPRVRSLLSRERARQSVEPLVEAVAGRSAGRLDVPVAVAHLLKAEL